MALEPVGVAGLRTPDQTERRDHVLVFHVSSTTARRLLSAAPGRAPKPISAAREAAPTPLPRESTHDASVGQKCTRVSGASQGQSAAVRNTSGVELPGFQILHPVAMPDFAPGTGPQPGAITAVVFAAGMPMHPGVGATLWLGPALWKSAVCSVLRQARRFSVAACSAFSLSSYSIPLRPLDRIPASSSLHLCARPCLKYQLLTQLVFADSSQSPDFFHVA